MRTKKEQNGNVSTKKVKENEIAFKEITNTFGISTNEAAKSFEQIGKLL